MNKELFDADARTLSSNITAIIYNGLLHDVAQTKSITKIRTEVDIFAKKHNLGQKQKQFLFFSCVDIYKKCYKGSFKDLHKAQKRKKDINYHIKLENASNELFSIIMKQIIFPDAIIKLANQVYIVKEKIEKNAYISDLVKIKDDKVFFLCSWHTNCALDHVSYQGKVYVSSHWRDYVSKDKWNSVESYIKNHDIKTIEWVSGGLGGVYLCTRPYCRHFFIALGVDEVLKASVNKLLAKHNAIKNDPAPLSDIEKTIRAYKGRLLVLKQLQTIMPNQKLTEEIHKTNKLYKKWANLK